MCITNEPDFKVISLHRKDNTEYHFWNVNFLIRLRDFLLGLFSGFSFSGESEKIRNFQWSGKIGECQFCRSPEISRKWQTFEECCQSDVFLLEKKMKNVQLCLKIIEEDWKNKKKIIRGKMATLFVEVVTNSDFPKESKGSSKLV